MFHVRYVSRETSYFSNMVSIAVADQLKTYYNDYSFNESVTTHACMRVVAGLHECQWYF